MWSDPNSFPDGSSVDVLVAGGGPAGIAAAVSSARMGARVLLVERYGFLGGTASMAGITAMCGMYKRSLENEPIEIVGGVGGEVLRALEAAGDYLGPLPVGETWLVPYNPFVYKYVMDDLVTGSGCGLLLHTTATDVQVNGSEIASVTIQTRGGSRTIHPKIVIDASGDADIAARAGVACRHGENGELQASTLAFHASNVEWSKAAQVSKPALRALMEQGVADGIDLPRVSGSIWPTGKPGEVFCNMTKITKPDGLLDLTDSDDLTFAEIEGRRQIRRYATFLKSYVPGFEEAFVSNSAPQVGVRESRLITGQYVLNEEDVRAGRRFDDSIAQAAWPIELHGTGATTTWEFLPAGMHYEIPFRALLPSNVDNLIVAGRSLSATHIAQASARVSATAFAMGQAAGVAAKVAVDNGITPTNVDTATLRHTLSGQGAII